ncbi:TetR/AcrR family transcriptional regulator [Cohnella pontilimi]|uniref:TetR/AcrR family transcriptional regulator n=1 Tax=Cohnella pontilimi TaxID=2564100 RepID=A0A4U0FFZ7_9BACL|nr:TetR/AcrR family transcriptional regulator [Cohnella pontilimi]TJY43903.1 TetR/AcrR family transcriptional regulator [Cohnella pontilimi]
MNKAIDPRVARTRRLLMDTLTELIVEEGYDAITIREIVRKAGVNRSTFYLHFRDKQDILTHMQEDILNGLAHSLNYPTYTYKSALQDYQSSKMPIKSHMAMFEHIQKHASLYRTMLIEREFRERVTQVIRTEVLRFRDSVWEAAFMSNGAVGVILYWLENGMKETITDMSLWLTRVILFPLGKFE